MTILGAVTNHYLVPLNRCSERLIIPNESDRRMRNKVGFRVRWTPALIALACSLTVVFAGASNAFAGTHHWASGASICGTAVCGPAGGGVYEGDCHASSNSVYAHRLDGPASNTMRLYTFHTTSGCTPTAVLCDVTANTASLACNPGGRTARGGFANLDNNYHSFNAHTTY